MKRFSLLAVGVLVLTVSGAASAAPLKGSVDGWLVHERAEFSVSMGPFGTFDAKTSGIGLGVRGHLMFTDQLFGALELQDAELTSFRLSGGTMMPLNPKTQAIFMASFVDKDLDDGIGLHAGVNYNVNPQMDLRGMLGYLLLGDFDGLELGVGGAFKIDRALSLTGDLRLFSGSADNDVDFETTELRFGASYAFTTR